MVNQKEYTTIVDSDDKKKRGVSFKILSGVAAAFALSSGGYHLLHSNNNSPQGGSMSLTNGLRTGSAPFGGKNGICKVNKDCESGFSCNPLRLGITMCGQCNQQDGCHRSMDMDVTSGVCMGKTNTAALGVVSCVGDEGHNLWNCHHSNCENSGGTYDSSQQICLLDHQSHCATIHKCCNIPPAVRVPVPVPVPSFADKQSLGVAYCGNLLDQNGKYIDVQDAISEANFNRANNNNQNRNTNMNQIAYRVRGYQNGHYQQKRGNTVVAFDYLYGGSCGGTCVAKWPVTPSCTY